MVVVKIKHLGTHSLIGAYIQQAEGQGVIEFQVSRVVNGTDLVQEIKNFETVYPKTNFKVFIV